MNHKQKLLVAAIKKILASPIKQSFINEGTISHIVLDLKCGVRIGRRVRFTEAARKKLATILAEYTRLLEAGPDAEITREPTYAENCQTQTEDDQASERDQEQESEDADCTYLLQVPILSGKTINSLAEQGLLNAESYEVILDEFAEGACVMYSSRPRQDVFGLRLTNDSMAPDLPPGAIVIVSMTDFPDIGNYGIALVNGKPLVRRIMEDGDQFILKPTNMEYENVRVSQSDLYIIGSVIQSIVVKNHASTQVI